MVLGWGKKTVSKHDEDEDMTMDEILASIRRYVTEDQNGSAETSGKQSSFVPQQESARFDPSLPGRQGFESASRMANYDTPYKTPEMVHEQAVMNEGPMSTTMSPESYLETMVQGEKIISPSISINPHSPLSSGLDYQPVSPSPLHHSHFQKPEEVFSEGVSAETTISAAALALSKLNEIKNEQSALRGAGALTLDTLIANLARPMIKEWLDNHLLQVVESMVEKEIERIRNYPTK